MTAKLNALPGATYPPTIQRANTSPYLFGWGVPTFDVVCTRQSLVRTSGAGAEGNRNYGRHSNQSLDAVIDRIKTEGDPQIRARALRQAQQLAQDDVALNPCITRCRPGWRAAT